MVKAWCREGNTDTAQKVAHCKPHEPIGQQGSLLFVKLPQQVSVILVYPVIVGDLNLLVTSAPIASSFLKDLLLVTTRLRIKDILAR